MDANSSFTWLVGCGRADLDRKVKAAPRARGPVEM